MLGNCCFPCCTMPFSTGEKLFAAPLHHFTNINQHSLPRRLCENSFVCRCRWVHKGICTAYALVWVLLFKRDALQPHNHHSTSQRFEHRVAESSQRQLEREWACAQVCTLYVMSASVCYCLSVPVCELLEWVFRPWREQEPANRYRRCNFLSSILEKIVATDRHLHKLSLQRLSYITCSDPSVKTNNSTCYFTQATPYNRLMPFLQPTE